MIEIPGYKIVRTLGKGGMARVYLAIQKSFEREVALKVMNPALAEDSKFTDRFLHEARIVSRLVHPNIVTVYDVGVHGNLHYLSMEYVPGMDLKQKRPFLTPPQSLQVIRDVAKALDYASRKGYVHRDVKPENIMLHSDDGRAVLMDFGIACLADSRSGMTQTGTAIGTPHYMSPEQARGRAVDSRADIYSLGVVLYLLLTGRVPYDGDSAVAIGIKHVQADIPRLPANLLVLQPIIDKVLAKEPDQRFQSGAELVAAIDAVTDEDIEAIQLATRNYQVLRQDQTSGPAAATVISQPARAVEKKPPAARMRSESSANKGAGSSPRRRPKKNAPARQPAAETPAGKPAREHDRSSAPPPRPEPGQAAAAEEVLAVDAEDRREPVEDKIGPWRWLLGSAALICLALTAAVYYRDQLPEPAAAFVEDGWNGSLELRDQMLAALGENGWFQPQPSAGPTRAEVADDAPPGATGEGPAGASGESDTAAMPAQNPGEPLWQQARALREELDTDLSAAPELAGLYRQILTRNGGDQKAEWGLRELLDLHYRRIGEALEQRELERAEELLASADASFPAAAEGAGIQLAGEDKYGRLQQQLENARAARRWQQSGDRLLAAGALLGPEDDNAVAAYRRALELDPQLPAARAGLEEVAGRLLNRAQRLADGGDLQPALDQVKSGLELAPAHEALAAMQTELLDQIGRRDTLAQLESRVAEQMAAENYLQPAGDSAHELYRRILALESGNLDARRGLARIERKLVQQTERHINRNQFDQARALLADTRRALGNSQRLNALEQALERAEEAAYLAQQPRIPQVGVSDRRSEEVHRSDKNTLRVDRTIHFGFEYENFAARTSIIQAMLYDGSRSVQIAQVPVVISGSEGVKVFQIERPVEGFPEGGYHIDLFLNDERLGTRAFKVERSSESSSASLSDLNSSSRE